MKESLIALTRDALGAMRDLLPIVVVISIFQIFVFRESAAALISMATGALLVVAGLTFFIFGLRLALFPVGEGLAHALARKGSVFWLVVFAFLTRFRYHDRRTCAHSDRRRSSGSSSQRWRNRIVLTKQRAAIRSDFD